MTTLLQPLQRVITEGTWTGLDVANGYITGISQISLLLDKISTSSKTALAIQFMVGTHVYVLLNRATQLNLIPQSPWLLCGVPIFITALNGYVVCRDQSLKKKETLSNRIFDKIHTYTPTLFNRIFDKIYTYTPKVCAIGNAALAVLEYRQNPVETAMNFTAQAIEWGARRYFPRHVVNVKDSTSLVAFMWLVYKGDPAQKHAGRIGLVVLGYRRWSGVEKIA